VTLSRWLVLLTAFLFLWPAAAGAQSPELLKATRQYTEYSLMGIFDSAIPFAEKAAALSEQELGADHPDTIDHLTALADFYHHVERHGAAADVQEKLLAISAGHLPPEHPELAAKRVALAKHYKADKRYDEAIPLLRDALAAQEKTFGLETATVATSLNELAILLRLRGDYDEAVPLAERALAIYEKLHGPEHLFVAIMHNNLGMIHHAAGRYDTAEHHYRLSLAIREKVQGADHPRVAQPRTSLAALDQARIAPASGGAKAADALHERYRGVDVIALTHGAERTYDVGLVAPDEVLNRVGAALDAIYTGSPFSAETLDGLRNAGTLTIVYNPEFPKEETGKLQMAAFQPDFFAAREAGGKMFLVVLGRHVVKLPARELGGVIVHELVGHGMQHLEGRLGAMREFDAECEAQLYQLSAYQDFGLDRMARDMVLFRRELEQVYCADFKRFMSADYAAGMMLWDSIDLDVPTILDIFTAYRRAISG
jgi:tetratricopeptide (TPR) repeat protein